MQLLSIIITKIPKLSLTSQWMMYNFVISRTKHQKYFPVLIMSQKILTNVQSSFTKVSGYISKYVNIFCQVISLCEKKYWLGRFFFRKERWLTKDIYVSRDLAKGPFCDVILTSHSDSLKISMKKRWVDKRYSPYCRNCPFFAVYKKVDTFYNVGCIFCQLIFFSWKDLVSLNEKSV